ncbi:hypothetical protein COLO4_06793 [Corchorus olitorius]|uniref:hAT-like transposase RNase-H fold domain-containing protein n=1 Tax=Corchorus olitorius TaxID=93759 RepID=A0A1R3KLZ1_9ROSI|nr:hypothetical protein COLO4_06793 [Corchorus olitorius]
MSYSSAYNYTSLASSSADSSSIPMAATASEDNEIVHLEEENNTELPIQVDATGNSVEVDDDDDPRNPKRIRKLTSAVWKELTIVKLPNGTNMGQQTIVIGAQVPGSSSLSSVQNWKYDHAKIRELVHIIKGYLVQQLRMIAGQVMRDSNYKHLPSDDDWVRVEEVCSFLTLFNEVTNIISGSDYPTSNLFLPELWIIKELIYDKCLSEMAWMKDMAEKMQLKFDKYWGECNLLISIAVVLDPRIDFAYKAIYSRDEASNQRRILLDSLNDLYMEYVDAYTTTNLENLQPNDKLQSDGTKSVSSNSGKMAVLTGRSKFFEDLLLLQFAPIGVMICAIEI